MGFWTAIAVIAIVAIVTESVIRIIKIGTRHSENIERIKHGYPTKDGAEPQFTGFPEASEHRPVEYSERLQ